MFVGERRSAHDRDRRVMLAVAAGLFAVALVLAARVHHTAGPLSVDVLARRGVGSSRLAAELGRHHLGRLDSPGFFAHLAWFGSPLAVAVMCGLLGAWVVWRRDLRAAVLCVVGPAAAGFLTELVAKPAIGRIIGTSFAFPSGHVTGAAAVTALATVLVYRYFGLRALCLLGPVLVALPVMVGIGTIGHGWHYFTDVVGGYCVGTGTVLLAAVAVLRDRPRGLRTAV